MHLTRVLWVVILSSHLGIAQTFMDWQYSDRYFSLNVGTGKAGYFGDLSDGKNFQKGLANYSLGLEARLLNKLSARVEMRMFDISGHDSQSSDIFNQQRNLSFRSNNFEFELSGMYYFLNAYQGKYFKRKPIDPYISAGIGVVFYDPKATLDSVEYKLKDFDLEGVNYKGSTIIIPFGIGAKLSLNEFINLVPELSFRVVFSDYLDDVAGNYIGPLDPGIRASLVNRKEEVGILDQNAYDRLVPGNMRGDLIKNDKYYFISAKLEIYLPPDILKNKGSRHSKQRIYKKPSAFDKM